MALTDYRYKDNEQADRQTQSQWQTEDMELPG